MKTLLWTMLYQIIDLMQATFKDFLFSKNPQIEDSKKK